jgi:transcriptional regulator with XRE-family HTH domain
MMDSKEKARIRHRVGARIRQVRKGLGYSLAGAARAWGMTQARLGGYERGDREPGITDLCEVAQAAGVDVHQLLPDVSPTDSQQGATP